MRERTVEQELIRATKMLGGEVRKVQFIGHRGAPDRMVMLPEVKTFYANIAAERFLVELKAPGKKLMAHQTREHNRLRKFGWRVEVVDSFERVAEVLR